MPPASGSPKVAAILRQINELQPRERGVLLRFLQLVAKYPNIPLLAGSLLDLISRGASDEQLEEFVDTLHVLETCHDEWLN